MFPGLSLRSNPGLKLANAFGVFLLAMHELSIDLGIVRGVGFRPFVYSRANNRSLNGRACEILGLDPLYVANEGSLSRLSHRIFPSRWSRE